MTSGIPVMSVNILLCIHLFVLHIYRLLTVRLFSILLSVCVPSGELFLCVMYFPPSQNLPHPSLLTLAVCETYI